MKTPLLCDRVQCTAIHRPREPDRVNIGWRGCGRRTAPRRDLAPHPKTCLPARADPRLTRSRRIERPLGVRRLVFSFSIALAACGYHARANLGPTVAMDGRTGAEVGLEAGTHLIGTQVAGMAVGGRIQLSRLDDETTVFLAFTSGTTAFPGFYGRDPLVPIEERGLVDTRGYGFHASGSIGGNTDGTLGGRAAIGVGHGRGHATDANRVRYVGYGGELAWQGDWEPLDDQQWDSVRQRLTLSLYVDLAGVPGSSWKLPFDIGPTKH
jgi:hypothetical protein